MFLWVLVKFCVLRVDMLVREEFASLYLLSILINSCTPNPIPSSSSSSPFPPLHPQSLHVNNALIATPHYWQPSFSFSLFFFPSNFLTNLASSSSSSLGNLNLFFSNFIVNNLVSLSLGNLILPGEWVG